MNEPISEESRFLAHARGGNNVFLTGMAGTGKSTLLRRFIGESLRKVDVTAPTGVAALNVSGMTIHRFCGMLLGPQSGQTSEQYFAQLENDGRPSVRAGFNRVRRCEILVIDEISMLPGRQFDFVEFLFRRLRGDERTFGGVQVIATGDFLQLPPVRKSENEPYDWAFQSRAWASAEFKTIVLETVRRQDEADFVRALSRFRIGRVQGDDARMLQSRVKNFPPANLTRLFTHNSQVDRWNSFQLEELPGEATTLEAVQDGPDLQREFLAKNLLTPATLRLKPGALVMFTVNKNERGQREPVFVNGQTGTVVELNDASIHVRVPNRDIIPVERFTWRYAQNDPESASFTQFPLRLAYAMTIHKSQGLTLDAAYLDIRAAREPGQAYVAVSRVRTLAGLHFKDWFKGVHVSDAAIQFYKEAA
ncbi:MAG TPA: AAA family ATPase [Candidatus Limnocylindria bacterium]|nr:AAA family ATPase [Candidatus Limnocylindria bacterium]